MKLSKPRIEYVYGEGRRISFLLHADSVKEAERLVDSAGDKTLEGVIKVFREKRSLTANAYFHVLVTKIAAALNTDIQSVKRRMVCSYGAVADKDNVPITVTVPTGFRQVTIKYLIIWSAITTRAPIISANKGIYPP